MIMQRRFATMVTLLFALFAGGCATSPPEIPSHFTLAHDQFYTEVRTIAIAPLTVPDDLANPAPVAEKFESLIAGLLRDAGYKVVPSHEYAALFEQEKAKQGGYFDAYTGKQDDAKYDAVLKTTREELSAKFNIDAVLFPRIQLVDAPWHDQWATWDGVTETIQSAVGLVGKGVLKFVNEPHMYLLEGPHEEGTVKAYSLAVSIEDLAGRKMYANQGGIQVLNKIAGNTFIPVSREELFNDDARNAKAVGIALESVSRAGCETDFQTSPCNAPRINLEPGTTKHLAFVVQRSQLSDSKDWERFRTEWNNAITASASSRGLEVISNASSISDLKAAVLAVVTINDFRYISQERYYWVGVMSGSPYIDADVDFYKLPDKTLLIRRQYKATAQSHAICSPDGICTFPPMTEKQIKLICDAIVAELLRP